MNKNNPLTKFFRGQIDDAIMSIIIVLSLVFLIIPKLADLDAETVRIFYIIDFGFLSLFLLEFILKLIFQGKEYFIDEDGWVDLIATLPVIVPLVRILLGYWNLNSYINSDVTTAVFLRGSGIIEVLRMLRMIRLLRLFYLIRSLSPLHIPRISITWPSIFCLAILISGYFFSSYTVNELRKDKKIQMEQMLHVASEKKVQDLFEKDTDILRINYNDIVLEKMTKNEIKNSFTQREFAIVNDPDFNMIWFSYREINNFSNAIQLFLLLIILFFLITIGMIFHISEKITKTEVKEALKEIIDVNK
jgi:hypothetical protein